MAIKEKRKLAGSVDFDKAFDRISMGIIELKTILKYIQRNWKKKYAN